MSGPEDTTRQAVAEARRRHYLQAMGIVVWRRREPLDDAVSSPSLEPPQTTSPADVTPARAARDSVAASGSVHKDPAQMDWAELEQTVAGCRRCALHEGRRNPVFGVGARDAQLLFVGEAPGAEEDRQGEPFVGAAGQLLNAMLHAIGLAREEVFIANILKCRPPGNRDPRPEEIACCNGYLQRQIELVAPRLVVALGRVAAQHCLASDAPLARLRGRLHEFGPRRIPLLATYHPAYLLRKPGDKRKSWEDLKRIRQVLGR